MPKPRGTLYTLREFGRPIPASDRGIEPSAEGASFDFLEQLQISSVQAVEVAPQEAGRNYLLIENIDTAIAIWVGLGSPARLGVGVRVVAGGNYERNRRVPINSIWILAESGTPNIILHRGIGA